MGMDPGIDLGCLHFPLSSAGKAGSVSPTTRDPIDLARHCSRPARWTTLDEFRWLKPCITCGDVFGLKGRFCQPDDSTDPIDLRRAALSSV